MAVQLRLLPLEPPPTAQALKLPALALQLRLAQVYEPEFVLQRPVGKFPSKFSVMIVVKLSADELDARSLLLASLMREIF